MMEEIAVIKKSESLLHRHGDMRRRFLRIIHDLHEVKHASKQDVSHIIAYLEDGDRPNSDIQFFVESIYNLPENHIEFESQVLELLDLIQDRSRNVLESQFLRGGKFEGPYAHVFRTLIEELDQSPQPTQTQLNNILHFIYNFPGNYIKEIHRQLQEVGEFSSSYQTLWKYVMDLEDRREILTIGASSGTRRYCFPHPQKIKHRNKYFGHLFPVNGSIARDLGDEVIAKSGFANAYLLNHQMEPLIFLTPANRTFEPENHIEGFGWLQSAEKLDTVIEIRGSGLPCEVVVPIQYHSSNHRHKINVSSSEFTDRFMPQNLRVANPLL